MDKKHSFKKENECFFPPVHEKEPIEKSDFHYIKLISIFEYLFLRVYEKSIGKLTELYSKTKTVIPLPAGSGINYFYKCRPRNQEPNRKSTG